MRAGSPGTRNRRVAPVPTVPTAPRASNPLWMILHAVRNGLARLWLHLHPAGRPARQVPLLRSRARPDRRGGLPGGLAGAAFPGPVRRRPLGGHGARRAHRGGGRHRRKRTVDALLGVPRVPVPAGARQRRGQPSDPPHHGGSSRRTSSAPNLGKPAFEISGFVLGPLVAAVAEPASACTRRSSSSPDCSWSPLRVVPPAAVGRAAKQATAGDPAPARRTGDARRARRPASRSTSRSECSRRSGRSCCATMEPRPGSSG